MELKSDMGHPASQRSAGSEAAGRRAQAVEWKEGQEGETMRRFEFAHVAEGIAREAGALLREFYAKGVEAEYKGDVDLVTEADRASEALIRARLTKGVPEHGIYCEGGTRDQMESEVRWSGDRLRDEMCVAERGRGAWLNGRQIHVSKTASLQEALTATGFPSHKRHVSPNIHFYQELTLRSHGVRRAGSAALDLAYVACGRLEGFWEFHLNPWDTSAGYLLVEEAGGRVTRFDGSRFRLDSSEVLATNGRIAGEMEHLFGELRSEER